MSNGDFESLRTAADYAGVSYFTVRSWALSYGIGRLEDGRWIIDREKLDVILKARRGLAKAKNELRQSAG